MSYAHIVVAQENSGNLMMKEIGFLNRVLLVREQDIFLRIGTKITKNTKVINN